MKSVLSVDDSKFMRMANEKALTRAGYDVVAARLGGVEVLRALRKYPLTASIPVVVLSSLPQKNEAKLLKEGATAYFDKSTLGLDQYSESLIQIVSRILGEQTEQNGNAELCGLGVPPLPGRSKL